MSKVWFVTGAGSGIGAAAARQALQAGDKVVATARSLQKLGEIFPGDGDDSLLKLQLDVRDEQAVNGAIQKAIAAFGRIDVLVNNAAYSIAGAFEEISGPELQAQFDTNLFGAANVLRAALPVMRTQGSGHVFNISSVAGVLGMKFASAYAATKFALEGLSLSMRHEVAPFGIKVTVVEPGYFRTSLLDANNVRFPAHRIDVYGTEALPEVMAGVHGNQAGDPAKLADALLKMVAMPNPPAIYVAGSDALDMIKPAIDERVNQMTAFEALSRSTDGQY